ncbi:MAG: hypothetical protein WCJ03_13205 [Bacteroidales bacterium]
MKRAFKQAFKPKDHVHCEPTVNDQRELIPCDKKLKIRMNA